MKKKIISAAVLLGLAGAANAVNIAPGGVGQVLIYPYFTANGGKSTQFSITNTTNRVKAVKVRLKRATDSKEALGFNLYLSPKDMWTGDISVGANGNIRLLSTDTSCVAGNKYDYSVFNLSKGVDFNVNMDKDLGVAADKKLREGYIEVIEMGDIDTSTPVGMNLAASATHVHPGEDTDGRQETDNAKPLNCTPFTIGWDSGGIWDREGLQGQNGNNQPGETYIEQTGFRGTSGGLFGSARIIEVTAGIDRAYDAVAIDNFWNQWARVDRDGNGIDNNDPWARVSAHSRPGANYPDLAGRVLYGSVGGDRVAFNRSSNVSHVMAPVARRGGQPNPNGVRQDVIETTFDGNRATLDAVSSVLTVENLYNHYYVDDGTNAATDWVITFPTKRAYVTNAADNTESYESNTTRGRHYFLRGRCATEGHPGIHNTGANAYCSPFGRYGSADDANDVEGVQFNPWVYSVEEAWQLSHFNQSENDYLFLSGENQTTLKKNFDWTKQFMQNEVNVLEFAKTRNVLDSNLAGKMETTYNQGWARVDFESNVDDGNGEVHGDTLVGRQTVNGAQQFGVNNNGDRSPLHNVFYGKPAIGFAVIEAQNGQLNGGNTLANYAELYEHKYDRMVLSRTSS